VIQKGFGTTAPPKNRTCKI